jgi:hypothetical protein
MRLLFTALACLISVSVSKPMFCQSVSLIIEEVDNYGIVSGTTYRLFAVLQSRQHSIHAVFADDSHPLKVLTSSKFFQHKHGGGLSSDVKKSKFIKYPALKYDSWVTIGAENNIEDNVTGYAIKNMSEFESGWNLSFYDAAWFVLPDDVNAFPKEGNKVLIMQITTDGVFSGILNFQGKDHLGETWRSYGLEFSSDKVRLEPESVKTSNNIRVRISESLLDVSKIAVIGKESTLCDGTIDNGQGLAELVEGELIGLYGVVERRHLEEILDEQRLAMSGLVFEDSDFAQAGCLAGAQGTVLASYGCLQGKTKLQIKLVDCSTSDLYWSATGFDVSEFDLLDALRVELSK